jgi:hypothetical protein
MLAAELHDKISPERPAHQRMEDVLTSHVFSLFRYLSNPALPFRLLGRAVNLAGQTLPISEARGCRLFFWQKFGLPGSRKRREIDAVLGWTAAEGRAIALGVENKDRSGASNTAADALEEETEEGTDAGPAFTGNQLADEYLGMRHGRWGNPECERLVQATTQRLLLYVTRHHELPVLEFERALGEVAARHPDMRAELERDVYWVNWQALHGLLTQEATALDVTYPVGEANLLRDVRSMLEARGLKMFQPYADLEELDELIRPEIA